MNLAVIGSGGREHAICYKLQQSKKIKKLVCIPGNAGTQKIAENVKEDIFFNKKELKIILNLYSRMVSNGEWKDYGLSISKKEVSFNVYHRTAEFPAYKITKSLKPKNKNEKYIIKDSKNNIVNNSEDLKILIGKVIWKKFKLVN